MIKGEHIQDEPSAIATLDFVAVELSTFNQNLVTQLHVTPKMTLSATDSRRTMSTFKMNLRTKLFKSSSSWSRKTKQRKNHFLVKELNYIANSQQNQMNHAT